jgi:hypothetical protein
VASPDTRLPGLGETSTLGDSSWERLSLDGVPGGVDLAPPRGEEVLGKSAGGNLDFPFKRGGHLRNDLQFGERHSFSLSEAHG